MFQQQFHIQKDIKMVSRIKNKIFSSFHYSTPKIFHERLRSGKLLVILCIELD